MGAYLYIKALHLVAVVSWFAGLLYIVRLFIYHAEAASRPEAERKVLEPQFALMERRLWYGITWPAMIAAAGFGLWMMVQIRAWEQPWFQLKAAFLVLLIGYHLYCGKIRKDLSLGRCRLSSGQLRVWNEVATLLLFAIVFTAVLKSPWAAGKGMLGVAAFAAVLVGVMAFVRVRRNGHGGRGKRAKD
jgi:putative membrane protein